MNKNNNNNNAVIIITYMYCKILILLCHYSCRCTTMINKDLFFIVNPNSMMLGAIILISTK